MRISPSLASAPLEHLAGVIAELESAGADLIHFDIEDGHFVPLMTLGTKIIGDLRPLSKRPFDVHLMVSQPENLVQEVVRLGADRVSVHYEACLYPRRVLRHIVSLGVPAGLAFNPATPLPDLTYLLPYLSFVVILSTEPEILDCPFLPETLEKVRQGKRMPALERVEWVVDGGITPENVKMVAEAGADTIVVGRAVFKEGRIRENLQALREALA